MRLMREPLVHFLLIGAAIFGLYGLVGNPVTPDARDRIVLTSGNVETLRSLWQKRAQRPPSDSELRELLAEQIREEVLYREALKLGLDRDDAVVRRRLAQKYMFLAEDLEAASEPDPAALAAWFDANRDRYRLPPRISFTQVYFDVDRRGADGERDARILLASLRSGAAGADPYSLGDGRLLDGTYYDKTPAEIAALFGSGFAERLLHLDPGIWSGPVASGYGLHLVRVDARNPGRVPPLSEVSERVRADFAYDARLRASDALYRRLLERYSVIVEADLPAEAEAIEDGSAR